MKNISFDKVNIDSGSGPINEACPEVSMMNVCRTKGRTFEGPSLTGRKARNKPHVS